MTDETIDSEGWNHTGDIACILPTRGEIKIIDRKKNIFKLSQGEYIAPEKLEGIYGLSPFIGQSFVYGDSTTAHLVGIIVPEEPYVMKWAKE